MKKKVGKYLAEVRKKKGVSKYYLNKNFGLKSQEIKSIERGTTNYTIDKLLTLCKALEIKNLEL
jgi:transcriptional regulator with XRE-family HTH domain